jgi:hypothetical protein
MLAFRSHMVLLQPQVRWVRSLLKQPPYSNSYFTKIVEFLRPIAGNRTPKSPSCRTSNAHTARTVKQAFQKNSAYQSILECVWEGRTMGPMGRPRLAQPGLCAFRRHPAPLAKACQRGSQYRVSQSWRKCRPRARCGEAPATVSN